MAVAQRLETQYICKFFRRSAEAPGIPPKTVGAALIEVFAVILPVKPTTLVDAPPDIGSEHGVCNA